MAAPGTRARRSHRGATAIDLSPNARRHLALRALPDRRLPAEALRSLLLGRGFEAPEPVISLEESAGGTRLSGNRLLGASNFLEAAPWLRPKDLPLEGGGPLLPVGGDPDQLTEDWEGAFLMMGASGEVFVYEAPSRPALLYESARHLLEVEGLAPLAPALHSLRVDAHCGELLAGLVCALLQPQCDGRNATAFAGNGVWVKELRTALHGPEVWGPFHGTFLLTEDTDLLVEARELLLAQGFAVDPR